MVKSRKQKCNFRDRTKLYQNNVREWMNTILTAHFSENHFSSKDARLFTYSRRRTFFYPVGQRHTII